MKKRRLIPFAFFLMLPFMLVGCGKSKKTTEKEKTTNITTEHVHVYGEWKTIVSPTCTEEGYKKRTCSCGREEHEVIEKKAHTYVDDKCNVCGFERLSEGFNVYYSKEDGKYHIDDYTGSSTTVRIPYYYDDSEHGEREIVIDKEHYNESIISKIGDCNIKKIIIGKGYETIPNEMFYGLNNLEEVVIEASVKTIGDEAFSNCPKLKSITYNETIEKIGFYAFAGCGFEEIRLPYYLKKLDTGAFSDNTSLSSITIYNNLISIGDEAFSNTALTSIKIPYTLTYFGYQGKMDKLATINVDPRNNLFVFENDCLIDVENNSLIKAVSTSVIPEGIISLEPYSLAYLDYSEVEEFVIPSSVKYFEHSVFKGSKFKKLVLNNNVIKIGEYAFFQTVFDDAENLVFTIPSSVQIIGPRAFSNFTCKEIILPNSVTELGYKVFENSTIEIIDIYKSTIISEDCDFNWNYGIDLDYTTINVIEDSE